MSNALPITVLVAIAIFLLKETLEFVKKNRTESRKIKAYKYILSEELEKNNYIISTLKRSLKDIESDFDEYQISLSKTNEGISLISFTRKQDGGKSTGPLPETHSSVFNKIFVEIAALDEELFNLAAEAYAGIAEVGHVRRSLIDYVVHKDEHPEDILVPFSSYGIEVLDDSHEKICALYRKCTGNELKIHKIRSYV
ncbi:hypothetical protein [Chromobacterium violaceum]|uniref:hypothetical protein n=1 Tax=Chromobacterium violaceum TaxID=536 RepID=UPI001C8B6184|nr:hypothetical protein [Chromobacterium violaceum]MBX9266813.1 hypothetical protein [Chromobacterium violaceum]